MLAGYPVIDVKVTLFDGSYHELDSNEIAFGIAGSMAFKEAARRASPVLLEPVMTVDTPKDYVGSIVGDLSSRRGRIESIDLRGDSAAINAVAPLRELLGYLSLLRTITDGRGYASIQFASYEPRSTDDGSGADEFGVPANMPRRQHRVVDSLLPSRTIYSID